LQASNLNHLEQGVKAVTDFANTVKDVKFTVSGEKLTVTKGDYSS